MLQKRSLAIHWKEEREDGSTSAKRFIFGNPKTTCSDDQLYTVAQALIPCLDVENATVSKIDYTTL